MITADGSPRELTTYPAVIGNSPDDYYRENQTMKHLSYATRPFGIFHDSRVARSGRAMLMGALVVAASISQAFADVAAVNINTASAEALANALNGVGIAKAYRIVEYREAHGPFEAIDELTEVKGIGDALVTRNRDLIVLQ